ncbi:MAG: ABC transporter substrate-binding protein, partial [Clostridiales bacterium]|nr:ABC transporter substrate-binding protein [Clostridiales bacterium]
MHRFITKAVVTASALCLPVAALAGCTKKPDAANNNAVVGITQEPGIFDPHTVVAAGDKEILFNVYEGLFKYDYEGNL